MYGIVGFIWLLSAVLAAAGLFQLFRRRPSFLCSRKVLRQLPVCLQREYISITGLASLLYGSLTAVLAPLSWLYFDLNYTFFVWVPLLILGLCGPAAINRDYLNRSASDC